jgi:ribosomal protein S18 acetylase RimI-like enzyme
MPHDSPVTSRPFVPGDLKALYAIEEVCFAPPLRFSRSLMRSLSEDSNCRTWVACVNGIRAGFAIVGLVREGDEFTAYIWTIEVLPGFRRLGIAKQLLARVEESAREGVCQSIELHVAEQNLEAQALYRGLGFAPIGLEPEFYGKGQNGLRYRKML